MASIPPATSSRNLVEVGDELSLERDKVSSKKHVKKEERRGVDRGKKNGKNGREKRPDPHSLRGRIF